MGWEQNEPPVLPRLDGEGAGGGGLRSRRMQREPTHVWHNNSSVSGGALMHMWSVCTAIYCVSPSLSDLVLAIYT